MWLPPCSPCSNSFDLKWPEAIFFKNVWLHYAPECAHFQNLSFLYGNTWKLGKFCGVPKIIGNHFRMKIWEQGTNQGPKWPTYLERGEKMLSDRCQWIFLIISWKKWGNMWKVANFAENNAYRGNLSHLLRILVIVVFQNAIKNQPINILRSSFLHCVPFGL